MNKMVIPNKEIEKTFLKEQREYLKELCDYAKNELGASNEQLVPFFSLIYIDWTPLSQKNIERGQQI